MSNVIPFPASQIPPPSREELVARVRALALHTENMRMDVPHLQKRMAQRGITMRQMLTVIREGVAIDGPKLDQWGDWRIKLARKVAGRRIQVVIAVAEKYFTPITVI